MNTEMDRQQNIDYLYLRAEECLLPEKALLFIKEKLEKTEMEILEKLKRISEKEFRNWCNNEEIN